MPRRRLGISLDFLYIGIDCSLFLVAQFYQKIAQPGLGQTASIGGGRVELRHTRFHGGSQECEGVLIGYLGCLELPGAAAAFRSAKASSSDASDV